MSTNEIIAIVMTIIGVGIFSIVFTILYRSLVKTEIEEIEAGEDDVLLIDEIIHINDKKVLKRKKIAGFFKLVIFYVFLVGLVGLAGYGVFSRITGNLPMIGGKAIMTVASGSMSRIHENNDYLVENNLDNQFPTFSIIVLTSIDSEADLDVYDVIAFVNDKGINVIHRITDIVVEDGVTRYITQGDANGEEDLYRPCFDDVVGKYNDKYIPFIGMFILFFQSYAGMITMAGVIYIILMIDRRNKIKDDVIDERLSFIKKNIKCYNNPSNEVFDEMIYYKEFVYYFNQDGFIKKESLLEDMPYFDMAKDKMVKVIKSKDSESGYSSFVPMNNSKGESKNG